MPKTLTADQAALRILISEKSPKAKQEALSKLAAVVEAQTNGGPCPNCGNAGPHDDNGEVGIHKSFCCTVCGEQWDAHPSW